jgi:hypothetical protein
MIARNGRPEKCVIDKTGLWLDQARPAAQATIDQLEKRMPTPLETQAESAPKND